VGDFSEVDICEAIRDTITLLKHGPDVSDKHRFEQDLPSPSIFISADITQIKQVFWNLARNALNAMPDGGTLTIRVSPLPVNRVRITFEDTGVGMSPEQVESLFEPFSRSTTGGTGLGLSIVYQIIRDHSGTINVRSTEGEGTFITIELPVENVKRPEPETTVDGEDRSALRESERSRLTEYLNVRDRDR
jgi:two-component system sensor histidine kinase PilS (NtrC family)